MLSDLPGVVTVVASEADGAPEMAWGDSFFYYDPDDSIPPDKRWPFATIVIQNYPGFDEQSKLDRPDVFRLNLNVGRDRFEQLLGFPPSAFDDHRDEFDYAALDRVIPHPLYGQQGWVSVVVPGADTGGLVAELITHAHRWAQRHS